MLVLVLEFSRISAASASRAPVGARVLHAGTSGPVGASFKRSRSSKTEDESPSDSQAPDRRLARKAHVAVV